MPAAEQKFCVLVTGDREAAVRRFLAIYIKPAFGMAKNIWRRCYREHYPLTVLSTPLHAGQDPAALYARHADSGVLVAAALSAKSPGSGRDAARAWLKAEGYGSMVELNYDADAPESGKIDQGALVVNFVNGNCPWRDNPIEDIDAYLAKNKPFWA
jgi:Tagatose-1,6-bisphosphate aldolase